MIPVILIAVLSVVLFVLGFVFGRLTRFPSEWEREDAEIRRRNAELRASIDRGRHQTDARP